MDPLRFDTLARSLAATSSRRGALAGLANGLLAVLLPGRNDETALAKRKRHPSSRRGHDRPQLGADRRKGHKKKKHGTAAPPPSPLPGSPPSPPSPPPPSPPSCPDGQRQCRGACLSVLICCNDTDCAGGRTCQAGTCGCPASKPVLCPGSTICQQCCAKADCATSSRTGPGIPECVANSCVCSEAGTRYCPNQHRCGTCCDDAECTNGEVCWSFFDTAPFQCSCYNARETCTAAGRTGCISSAATCHNACGAFCNPETGCPCSTDLVCDYDPATQDCCYCRARSAG